MFDNFGFSYVGLIFLLMLTIPNLIWTKNKPKDYEVQSESQVLLIFERIGQVSVTVIALITRSFDPQEINSWTTFLIIAFLLMVMYECWWLKYFRSKKEMKDFYSSFLGVPVAGATLPVVAFFLLGIYGKSLLMIIAIVVLGIGHIGIHLEHRKKLKI